VDKLSKIREKVRGLSPGDIAGEALLRARRKFSRSLSRALDHPGSGYVTDEELRRSLEGHSLSDVTQNIREPRRTHLTAGLSDLGRTAEIIHQNFPESVAETTREADSILSHRITVFGREFQMGPLIDWHADPFTQVRWPLLHYAEMPMRAGHGSDVRTVWELNRLQHLPALGRAFALTGDETYSDEFLLQIASWYEENPPRFGVNWTVAMEAGIRAVNILAALGLFRASRNMTEEVVELILKMMLAHGRFIRSNLEFSHRAASNHYLSNLIGLYSIGMMLPELKESRAWVSYSAPRLLEELDRQVLPDGVSYEGSTSYHRFVLEIFALFFALSRASRVDLPGKAWERLERMFEFTRHYLKPDGTAPIIGDSDDGRLLKFRERPAIEHSYLLSLAAVLVENDAFKQSSRLDEEAIWWFGEEGREAFESLSAAEDQAQSRAFDDAQIFVQRRGPFYSIIDCGDHGANGHGSHAHSDALSFEIFAFGRTFLRDPGTFVYTADERWRNTFRSTPYHNTVRIDRRDISRVSEGQVFALGPNVAPRVNRWESTVERDVLDAEHHAYADLAEPVIHRRVFTFEKQEGFWIIRDIFEGRGEHGFEFFFNFDSGLEVAVEDENRAVARDLARNREYALAVIPRNGNDLEVRRARRWTSEAYGTRTRSSGIIYRAARTVPFEVVFLVVPFRAGEEERLEKVPGESADGSL